MMDLHKEEEECNCEFDVDLESEYENTPETAWHYRRLCDTCGSVHYTLHCRHEGPRSCNTPECTGHLI